MSVCRGKDKIHTVVLHHKEGNKMKIVFADADSLGNDISLEKYRNLGEVEINGMLKPEELKAHCENAGILVANKTPCNRDTLGDSPALRLIALTATGTNIVDMDYAKAHGIAVANVGGYSTEAVTQHTFALLFYLLEKSAYYDNYVKSEKYVDDVMFTHFGKTFHELCGMTWGIAGLGNIGKRVASVAKAFGCRVIYYSTSGKNNDADFERVDFDTLLTSSDIISIHAPLNKDTENLFNGDAFNKMKKSAILINVGRGPIVNEKALYDALSQNRIQAAGLDVLAAEPMRGDNPLKDFKDSGRLIITPHIAWAAYETRVRLVDEVYKNIEAFLKGEVRNRVV